MVLSDQAQRAWKLVTTIATAATGFYVVFHADYGKQDHVFSDVQRWYRRSIDNMILGSDKDVVKQLRQINRDKESDQGGE